MEGVGDLMISCNKKDLEFAIFILFEKIGL
jgi:hypothetical protein